MIQQPESIIFDFDYTLADSSAPVVECVNYALRALELPEAEPQAIRRLIGYDLRHTLAALAGERADGKDDDFLDFFVKRADEVMVEGTVMLEPAAAAVDALAGRSRLGIVSSKNRSRIEEILRRERLLDRFHAIVGGDDVANLKPHPDGVLKAIEALGAPSARSLYVGDSVVDAEAAQRAGVRFVAVLSGVTAASEFDGYDAAAVIDSVAGLLRLFGGRGA